MKPLLDGVDRRIINLLQEGLQMVEAPFAAAAEKLDIAEADLLARLAALKAAGALSRIGPMYNSSRFGGGLTLCAMTVPASRFDEVAAIVNSFPEVAHNYEREHSFNMWFVLATEWEEQVASVLAEIERLTEIRVLNLPKLDEYYIGLRVKA
ncbi:MAG: AsnC family transcriptional regulator [Hyphomicrobiales bacterium]|nr:AsnC family transcriptional regulator [Hyphomicrobiales bacterium]